ncbi:hypothetical protein QBC33DRAFT_567560 [Phialemonium atrogriseum]|uniref:Endo-1,3(4)-beta-glucanase 1 carbohydrate binding domain-containing protein n=1 Tax=Phialemonium atrogriseum TaxID=1093897 RepID=A0AAJ0C4W7_9PEZI|nr:uncharacterized protein QBC33DRAFT_567560 [Phialemonium atrogriseum]KAK1770213.1 hypothetical protein QBC33DRAFT_567560 [Phialemonium atrogriseum]
MAATRAFTILALVASLMSPVRAEDMDSCGEASYFPSEYTCYDNSTLCPITFNLPTVPCEGAGGCYASEMFSCKDGELETLPEATGPFTLTAHGMRPAYQNLTVKACGNYLAIGANARECTSCAGAGPDVQCESYRNNTVLLPNGKMSVDVPGGQYWYVDPNNGLLQYTADGNSTAIKWAGHNVTVYEDGFFVYDSMPHYWLACLRTLPGGVPGTGRTYRIYASTFSNLESGDCEPIRLATKSVDKTEGAYKYL